MWWCPTAVDVSLPSSGCDKGGGGGRVGLTVSVPCPGAVACCAVFCCATPRRSALCCAGLCSAVPCRAVSCRVVPRCAVTGCVLPCCAAPRRAVLCPVAGRCGVLYCGVACCVPLCRVVLCFAVPCCAVGQSYSWFAVGWCRRWSDWWLCCVGRELVSCGRLAAGGRGLA